MRYPIRKTRSHGFTLLELIVTLAVSGFVLAIAHGVVVTVADGADRIGSTAVSNDRSANAVRLLRELLGRLEVSKEQLFDGDSSAVRFTSWCAVPEGWLERCRVTISLEPDSGKLALVASAPPARPIVLERAIADGALRYLDNPGSGGSWAHSWGASITAPLAIGIVLDTDTLIVRIGDRG